MRLSLLLGLILSAWAASGTSVQALEPWLRDSASSSATEASAVEQIPFSRINGPAQQSIRGVVERPSFFRRLPQQTIECDPELFLLLVRYPEIIVNIWDLMGITKVEVKRIAPYIFTGTDGAGTSCRCELLYGTSDVHVYYGNGTYSGSMAARNIDGRCVCVLHSSTSFNELGRAIITVSMDVFMKLDSLGADLVTRTLAPLVGKTADYNFAESAKFVSQLNELCEQNPRAAQELALRLNRVDPTVRAKFAQVAANIAAVRGTIDSRMVAGQSAAVPAPPAAQAAPPRSTPVSAPAAPAISQALAPREELSTDRVPANAASLSDGGIITPAKPPVMLRR